MTVLLVISLPKILYIHRIYMVLANPSDGEVLGNMTSRCRVIRECTSRSGPCGVWAHCERGWSCRMHIRLPHIFTHLTEHLALRNMATSFPRTSQKEAHLPMTRCSHFLTSQKETHLPMTRCLTHGSVHTTLKGLPRMGTKSVVPSSL